MTDNHILAVDGLSGGYYGRDVISGISFGVEQGEVVGISGPNSCGKTTLFRCISGLIRRSTGTILYLHRDISRCSSFQISRQGLVHLPQNSCLFLDMTVRENLMLGASCADMLPRFGRMLEEVVHIFPQLHALMNRNVRELSGGEQKIVAIARSIVSKPRVLLLDEPTAGLEDACVASLSARLRENLLGAECLLIVEQNTGFLDRVETRRIEMFDGRIVADGSCKQPYVD